MENQSPLSQRAWFRIALEIATDRHGEKRTVTWFAEKHGVSTHSVYLVLDGEMTSARLERAIEEFIDAQLSYVDQQSDTLQPTA